MMVVLMVAMLAASPVDRLLDAMEQVESGGHRYAVGDGGNSHGPLQIQHAYWIDAGYRGTYAKYLRDVRDPAKAREVAKAWWRRHAAEALRMGNLEVLARRHNGGPRGERVKQTQVYWAKVRREMKRR